MAHQEQMNFVQTVAEHISPSGYNNKKVLEIGSYNVNGTIRPFFDKSEYIGVDLVEGDGVDYICSGSQVPFADNKFDITISCECFEHDPEWNKTFFNMYRMVKPGGVLCFTCATRGRIEHGTTNRSPIKSPGTQSVGWDYYRNLTTKDFKKKIDFGKMFSCYLFIENKYSKDLYFVGKKLGDCVSLNLDIELFRTQYEDLKQCIEKPIESKSKYPSLLLSIAKLHIIPIKLAENLPDPYFQKFFRFYWAYDHKIKSIVKRMISGFI